jgi:hypothetical protein
VTIDLSSPTSFFINPLSFSITSSRDNLPPSFWILALLPPNHSVFDQSDLTSPRLKCLTQCPCFQILYTPVISHQPNIVVVRARFYITKLRVCCPLLVQSSILRGALCGP